MIFIDESGDPGLRKGRSDYFIIAAVIVVGQKNCDAIANAIEEHKRNLGWNENEELKFHKTHKNIIKQTIKMLHKYDYSAYAIALDKAKINRQTHSFEKDSIFLYVIKELLIKIEPKKSNIIIDGVRGPKYVKKARTYFRNELKSHNIEVGRIIFENSISNPLIQLADLVAGSVARTLTNKTDAREYVRLFGNKIKIYKI